MAAPSDVPSGPEFETDFLRVLNNPAKQKRGFVVFVRGSSSLKRLQELCRNQNQTDVTRLTARYRLQPGAAVGTLLVALLSDLKTIDSGRTKLHGEFSPTADSDPWKALARQCLESLGITTSGTTSSTPPSVSPAIPIDLEQTRRMLSKADQLGLQITTEEAEEFLSSINQLSPIAQGDLTQAHLTMLTRSLARESVLPADYRLVLFGELIEEATDLDEWKVAMAGLFSELPERVGLVFSGVPKEFTVAAQDRHLLEISLPKEDDAAKPDQAQLAYVYADSSFHSDVPAEKDELGVSDYADALARFVLHQHTNPPLTIGIHGPWGKGKSSFMKLIDSALIRYAEVNRDIKQPELNGETRTQAWNDLVAKRIKAELMVQTSPPTNDKTTDEELQRRRQELIEADNLRTEEEVLWQTMRKEARKNVLGVVFNAWQFEDAKQTWAGLASKITESMEEALPRRSRQWLKLRYAWKERKSEVILNVLLPLAVVCLVGGLFSLGAFRNIVLPSESGSNLANLLRLLLPAGSAILIIWFVSSQFLKVAQPISERVLSYVRLPNYRDQMGFQHRVKEDVQFVYEFLARHRKERYYFSQKFRVVVYIDDLDRCSENKIMEILQAINLILAGCEFFVFVGMDTDMIYRAINSYYKESVSDRLADNYLSKVIQISFYLPETKAHTKAEYLSTLFSAAARLELKNRTNKEANNKEGGEDPGTETADRPLPYNLAQLLTIVPVQLKEAEDTPEELEAFTAYSDFIDDNPREMKRLINIHRLIKVLVRRPNSSWSIERQKKLVKWLIFCDTWPHLVGRVLESIKDSSSKNCLLDMAVLLERAAKKPVASDPVPSFDRLKEFASFVPPRGKTPEDLTAEDIDEDFRSAAKLSQLVRKPPPQVGRVLRPKQ